MCGRLFCCLTFENDQYLATKGQFPKVGSKLQWATGTAKVVKIDVIRNSMSLYNEAADESYEVSADEWKELQERQMAFRPTPFGKPVVPDVDADDETGLEDVEE